MLIPSLVQRHSGTNVMLRSTTSLHPFSSFSTAFNCCNSKGSTALHLVSSIGDASSAVSTIFSVDATATTKTLGILAAYSLFANLLYLARRANLRKMTMRDLWKIRTTREEGVSRLLFTGIIAAWQVLVLVFPIVEPCLRYFASSTYSPWMLGRHEALLSTKPKSTHPQNTNQPGWTIFFYSYPKAQGGGYILEPLACQHLGANQRAKQQIRFDWHSFKYNVGPIGRDGFRHPPSIERNLPHMDIPRYQMRHWPWRKQYKIASDENGEE